MNAIPTIAIVPRGAFQVAGGFTFPGDVDFDADNKHPVSALPTGGFVITARSVQDDIIAAVFDAAGNAVVPTFMVNQTLVNVQGQPDVAVLPGGGFVVTWTDQFDPFTERGLAIKARIFDAAGAPLTDEFAVSAAAGVNQSRSQVAALTTGGFVVTWQIAGDSWAQIYDAAGAEVGTDFLVHAPDPDSQQRPAITALEGGGFVVTWADEDIGILAQIFDAAGNQVGAAFEVSPYHASGLYSGVAALPSGGFVVVRGETGRIFDANGAAVGDEFVVREFGFGGARWFDIASLPTGGFVISWFESHSAVRPDGLFAQQFDAEGQPVGGDIYYGDSGSLGGLAGGGFVAGRTLYEPPSAYRAFEALALDLKGTIALNDADAGSAIFTVTLSVDYGVLDVTAGGSGASVGGSGTGSVTVTGTLSQIQALLASDASSSATFTANTASPPASAELIVEIDDGSGGVADSSKTIDIVDLDFPPGTPGADTIDGIGDALWMAGGAGDDTYIASDDDVIEEAANEGFDTVYALSDHVLRPGQHVEILSAYSIAWTSMLRLTGNELDNILAGSNGPNRLRGGGGNDYIMAFEGDDRLFGDEGDDRLFGGAGSDALYGGGGNDFLDGGADNDFMSGGMGDDVYIVSDDNEGIQEATNGGYDVAYVAVSFNLADDQEVELLSAFSIASTVSIRLDGNNLNNLIIGNMGVNRITGSGGDDYIAAFGANDDLFGNDGNDTIDGGDGGDTMSGGAGNDRLFGDEGMDQLEGGADNDVLDGGADNDTMLGGAGNDIYYAETGDTVTEAANEGTDLVYVLGDYVLAAGSHVEIVSSASIANQSALSLTGNELVNTLAGTNAADVLDGKGGSDWLVGHGGADSFRFTTTLDAAANVDAIEGFQSGTDTIALDDAVFAGLSPGALPAGAFVTGTAAGDADDRIIYNSATGQLFFDADGNGSGAQVLFASLFQAPALAASDFIVI